MVRHLKEGKFLLKDSSKEENLDVTCTCTSSENALATKKVNYFHIKLIVKFVTQHGALLSCLLVELEVHEDPAAIFVPEN